jgi:hypothetical protein
VGDAAQIKSLAFPENSVPFRVKGKGVPPDEGVFAVNKIRERITLHN